jgi:hypothetical protein
MRSDPQGEKRWTYIPEQTLERAVAKIRSVPEEPTLPQHDDARG